MPLCSTYITSRDSPQPNPSCDPFDEPQNDPQTPIIDATALLCRESGPRFTVLLMMVIITIMARVVWANIYQPTNQPSSITAVGTHANSHFTSTLLLTPQLLLYHTIHDTKVVIIKEDKTSKRCHLTDNLN